MEQQIFNRCTVGIVIEQSPEKAQPASIALIDIQGFAAHTSGAIQVVTKRAGNRPFAVCSVQPVVNDKAGACIRLGIDSGIQVIIGRDLSPRIVMVEIADAAFLFKNLQQGIPIVLHTDVEHQNLCVFFMPDSLQQSDVSLYSGYQHTVPWKFPSYLDQATDAISISIEHVKAFGR